MTPPRALGLALLAAALPAAAQGALDSPAFGGSRIFSEGVSSLGNPARFDRCLPGWYFSALDGDLKAKGLADALDRLAKGADPAGALADLADAPWASRANGFGLTLTQAGLHGAVAQERWNGLTATVDRDPSHLGPGLGLNATSAQVLRADVQRVVLGAGSAEGRSGYGFAVRLERWTVLRRTAALNPVAGQEALTRGSALLDASGPGDATLDVNVNGGYVAELGGGVRFGVLGDHLLPKTVAGVAQRAQLRAGFQVDAGPGAQVSVEADLNEATRLPLTLPQKSLSASVRLGFGPSVGLTLGAERRSVGGSATTTAGATLYWKLPALSLGFGFRFAEDRPLKALLVRVDA
jgi:hypothetical protein